MMRVPWLLPILAACTAPAELTREEYADLEELRWAEPPPEVPANAEGNPVWDDPAAQRLGRRLYFDEGMSADGTVSCNTCHDVSTSGADPRGTPLSAGVFGVSIRNTPTLYNAHRRKVFGWLQVQTALWRQILTPLTNDFQGLTHQDIAARACSTWRADFEAVFEPCPPDQGEPRGEVYDAAVAERISEDVARALGAYVRTLVSRDSAFDRFMGPDYDERDPSALSPDAVRGARLFVGDAMCNECHFGPTFSDHGVHVLGIDGTPAGDEEVAHQTPPLRGVSLSPPYMHDGGLHDLQDVLEFYRYGGNGLGGPARAVELEPLDLTDSDLLDLERFLCSLEGEPLPYCHVTDDPECCDPDGEPLPGVDDVCAERMLRPQACR